MAFNQSIVCSQLELSKVLPSLTVQDGIHHVLYYQRNVSSTVSVGYMDLVRMSQCM